MLERFQSLLHFHPLRDRRRRALLARPMPEAWREYLRANIGHYAYLTDDEKARLEDDARLFIAEKTWEGGGGAEVTDEMRVTIAAQACLLLLGWDDARRADLFSNVVTVIVYPTGYRASDTMRQGAVTVEGRTSRLGEAWGADLPVILSWRSARAGARDPDDGRNVVLHEFAHKLDMVDGAADGVPRLASAAAYDAWAEVMSAEYQSLRYDARHRNPTLLDTYGATDEGEFFAVATEAFFEMATRMRDDHPRLYAVLRDYYAQDPAARIDAWRASHPELSPEADTHFYGATVPYPTPSPDPGS